MREWREEKWEYKLTLYCATLGNSSNAVGQHNRVSATPGSTTPSTSSQGARCHVSLCSQG